mmetsp:Transcript_15140/g.32841  ORF Transcript_15140/g.32841 Transcript_15140/m.32841 type:complete len:833 (-) Transcript_15140:517-3015(-)
MNLVRLCCLTPGVDKYEPRTSSHERDSSVETRTDLKDSKTKVIEAQALGSATDRSIALVEGAHAQPPTGEAQHLLYSIHQAADDEQVSKVKVGLAEQATTGASASSANAKDKTDVGSEASTQSSGGSAAALQAKLHVDFRDLTFHELIGKGSFKTVYRGRWNNTNVAIVSMRKGGMVTEARVLQRMSNHPNLVQFYRWTTDNKGNEYMVMELVKLGSLDKLLLAFGNAIRTRARLAMCEQVCSAMCELADEGVLHRDLAARNILVSSMEPVHVKVTDFGLASVGTDSSGTHSGSSQLVKISVPVRWTPPEVLTRGAWSEKSDVWSFAVTMWEVFSDGAEPYARMSDEQVYTSVLSGTRLPRPTRCPKDVYKLMTSCWHQSPESRPSFADIAQTFRRWRETFLANRVKAVPRFPAGIHERAAQRQQEAEQASSQSPDQAQREASIAQPSSSEPQLSPLQQRQVESGSVSAAQPRAEDSLKPSVNTNAVQSVTVAEGSNIRRHYTADTPRAAAVQDAQLEVVRSGEVAGTSYAGGEGILLPDITRNSLSDDGCSMRQDALMDTPTSHLDSSSSASSLLKSRGVSFSLNSLELGPSHHWGQQQHDAAAKQVCRDLGNLQSGGGQDGNSPSQTATRYGYLMTHEDSVHMSFDVEVPIEPTISFSTMHSIHQSPLSTWDRSTGLLHISNGGGNAMPSNGSIVGAVNRISRLTPGALCSRGEVGSPTVTVVGLGARYRSRSAMRRSHSNLESIYEQSMRFLDVQQPAAGAGSAGPSTLRGRMAGPSGAAAQARLLSPRSRDLPGVTLNVPKPTAREMRHNPYVDIQSLALPRLIHEAG